MSIIWKIAIDLKMYNTGNYHTITTQARPNMLLVVIMVQIYTNSLEATSS